MTKTTHFTQEIVNSKTKSNNKSVFQIKNNHFLVLYWYISEENNQKN